MPIIGGRYYMNPAMGQALEEARELARPGARASIGSGPAERASGAAADGNEVIRDARGRFVPPGAIHRIEIEAAELGAGRSRQAPRGFVARIHRLPAEGAPSDGVGMSEEEMAPALHPADVFRAARPTTHVFAGHHDLLDFLREELARSEE